MAVDGIVIDLLKLYDYIDHRVNEYKKVGAWLDTGWATEAIDSYTDMKQRLADLLESHAISDAKLADSIHKKLSASSHASQA
jgi:hypothetical protein